MSIFQIFIMHVPLMSLSSIRLGPLGGSNNRACYKTSKTTFYNDQPRYYIKEMTINSMKASSCLLKKSYSESLISKVGSNRMIFPKELDMVITNTVLLLVVWPLTFDFAAVGLVRNKLKKCLPKKDHQQNTQKKRLPKNKKKWYTK